MIKITLAQIFLLSIFLGVTLSTQLTFTSDHVTKLSIKESLFVLGTFFDPRCPNGKTKKLLKAIQFYTEAANKGSINAMLNLGIICELDYKNIQQAKKWYSDAAQKGSKEAIERLGILKQNEESIVVQSNHTSTAKSSEVESQNMTIPTASGSSAISSSQVADDIIIDEKDYVLIEQKDTDSKS